MHTYIHTHTHTHAHTHTHTHTHTFTYTYTYTCVCGYIEDMCTWAAGAAREGCVLGKLDTPVAGKANGFLTSNGGIRCGCVMCVSVIAGGEKGYRTST